MGILLEEVIEAAGYNLQTKEDAIWLLSKQSEFEELVEQANKVVEESEDD